MNKETSELSGGNGVVRSSVIITNPSAIIVGLGSLTTSVESIEMVQRKQQICHQQLRRVSPPPQQAYAT
jgi:type III secretory pathway component EscU